MIKRLIILMLIITTYSCNSDLGERPIVTTNTNTVVVVGVEVTLTGTVEDDGGSDIVTYGFCYSYNDNPTFGDSTFTDIHRVGNVYTGTIKDLEPYKTYYIRAYVRNDIGVGYGDVVSFTTGDVVVNPPCNPAINTFTFNGITNTYSSIGINDSGSDYLIYSESYTSNTRLKFHFYGVPVSGVYPVSNSYLDSSLSDKCYISFEYGNWSTYSFKATEGENSNVYVKKTDTNKYIITFCDLEFTSNQTSIVFNTDGNLTKQ